MPVPGQLLQRQALGLPVRPPPSDYRATAQSLPKHVNQPSKSPCTYAFHRDLRNAEAM
jgi:hypothetical protein